MYSKTKYMKSPEEKRKLKLAKQSFQKEKQKTTEILINDGIIKPSAFKGKIQTKGSVVKSEDNSSDHSIPSYIFDAVVKAMRKYYSDFGENETTIDLCCDIDNCKFDSGLTENGSIRLPTKLEGDSLEQDWGKLGFKYGWMAAPYYSDKYKNRVQSMFVEKAAIAAKNTGMIIIAFIQASVGAAYFQDYVSYDNPNCTYIELRGRLKFDEYVNVPGFDNCLAIFGLPKGLLPNEIRDEIRFLKKRRNVKDTPDGRLLPTEMSGKQYKNWMKS